LPRFKAFKRTFFDIRDHLAKRLDLLSVWGTQAIPRDPLMHRRSPDAPLPFDLVKIATVPVRGLPDSFDPVPFQARPDLDPIAVQVPVDWNQDPFSDRNWCAQLNMVRFPDPHIARFEETGDPRWLRWLIELLCDWHHFHVLRERKSRYGWGDMMTGQRAARLAYVLGADLARPGVLTRRERVLLIHSALAHVHRMIAVTPVRMTNHTVDDLIGLRALQQVIPGQRVRAQIEAFVADVFPRLMAVQFTDDGVHRENSPAYHFYIVDRLKLLHRMEWFGGFGLEELIERIEPLSQWFRQPDGNVVPVGDSNGNSAGRLTKRFDARTGLLRADGYVIRRDCTGPGQTPPESYFFFMGSAHSGVHKHNDCLSYSWFDRSPVVTDTGKYAYKNDLARSYAVSARAHNTVEIGERDPLPNTLAGLEAYPWGGDLVRTVHETPLGTLVSGRVVHPRLRAAHTRTILFRPGRFLLTADLIEDLPEPWPADWPDDGKGGPAGPRPVTQWTHFAPAIQMKRRDAFFYEGLTKDARKVQLQLAVGEGSAQSAGTTLHRGESKPRLQGWASEAYAKLTPRDAIGLTTSHGDRTWLASLITLGLPASRFLWDENGQLSAVFDNETVVLQPDDGQSGPAAHS